MNRGLSVHNNKDTGVSKDNFNTSWVDEYGVVFSSDKKWLFRAPEDISEYTIPDGTKVICEEAFGAKNDYNTLRCVTYRA